MMTHISTRGVGDDVEAIYYVKGTGEPFSYRLRRICAGMSYPNANAKEESLSMGFLSVWGERAIYYQDRTIPPERFYICLDEFETIDDVGLLEAAISIKDRYLVQTIVVPTKPISAAEAVSRFEGISWYREARPIELSEKWKTFVSSDTIASVRKLDVPDRFTVRRDLEVLRKARVRDPVSDTFLMDRDFKYINRIVIPDGFNNQKTSVGLAAGNFDVSTSCWLALSHMEKTWPMISQ